MVSCLESISIERGKTKTSVHTTATASQGEMLHGADEDEWEIKLKTSTLQKAKENESDQVRIGF